MNKTYHGLNWRPTTIFALCFMCITSTGFAYSDNPAKNEQPIPQNSCAPKYYVGMGISKSLFMLGKMSSEYKNKENAWTAPGNFNKSEFQADTNKNLHLAFGTMPTNNIRIEFSYSHYSGISVDLDYKNLLAIDPQVTNGRGIFKFTDKPELSSDAVMLNVYYYLDRLIGTYKFRPYVGAGVGMSGNKISDYIIADFTSYIIPGMQDTVQPVGTPITFGSFNARHTGKTTDNLACSFEVGATYTLTPRTLIDIFGRYVNLGKFESKGIISNYFAYVSVSDTIPVGPPYNHGVPGSNETSYFPDWKESGNLGMFDLGFKLRFLF